VIVDHISVSWAIDENMNAWYDGIHDISVANTIISEGLWHSLHPKGAHSKGFLVGPGTHNLSVIGNLFAHNNARNMLVDGDTSTLFVNNLIYNWGNPEWWAYASVYAGADSSRPLDASIVGNVYRSPILENARHIKTKRAPKGSRIYIKDNQAFEKSGDKWKIKKLYFKDGNIKTSDKPPIWIPSLEAKKVGNVQKWVLANAGARPIDRDQVDWRIINGVKAGTGRLIDSQNDVGGWPPLAENVRGVGGIAKLVIPSNEIQPSGYTKLEEWLHELARKVENAP
jgi:hypothetical protein